MKISLDVNHAKIDNLSDDEIRRVLEQILLSKYEQYPINIQTAIHDYFLAQGNSYTYLNFITPLKTNKIPQAVEKVRENLDVFNTDIRKYSAYLEKILSNKEPISPRTLTEIRKDILAITKSLLDVKTIIRFENSNTFLSTIIELQKQINALLVHHPNDLFTFSAIQKKLSEIHFSLESHVDMLSIVDILEIDILKKSDILKK